MDLKGGEGREEGRREVLTVNWDNEVRRVAWRGTVGGGGEMKSLIVVMRRSV